MGCSFFEAGLEEKVITVPGAFFDVDPERRRSSGRYRPYARISFGPKMETLEKGLDGLERVIAKYGPKPVMDEQTRPSNGQVVATG